MIGEIEEDFHEFATDEHYCRHGSYIGSWAGPDHLCWACELGLTDAEWREHCWWDAWNRHAEKVKSWVRAFDAIGTAVASGEIPRSTGHRFITNVLTGDLFTEEHSIEQLDRLATNAPRGVAVPAWWPDPDWKGVDA